MGKSPYIIRSRKLVRLLATKLVNLKASLGNRALLGFLSYEYSVPPILQFEVMLIPFFKFSAFIARLLFQEHLVIKIVSFFYEWLNCTLKHPDELTNLV